MCNNNGLNNNYDISINIPAEYAGDIKKVIDAGIKYAKIKSQDRQQIRDWWTAEQEFINQDLKSLEI